ncbi:MAG: hypothetical protein ACTHL8_18635 [Burkholderiaceae bacterium]
MRTTTHLGAAGALGCLLAACGGGGGDGNTGGASGQPPAGATTYTQTTPVAGATDVFSITSVDDSNNTVTVGYTQRVASVTGPHSYVLTQVDPSNDSPVVNGVNYHFNATTITYDQGSETSLTDTSAGGTVQDCTFALQSGGHPNPWWVGQAYSYAVQENCTPGDLRSIAESGTVAALEQVTVPAGTFTALKLQASETWVENGQTVDEQITRWVDPAHSFFTIKTVTTYTRSGNVPAHYVTSQTVELQSRTGG